MEHLYVSNESDAEKPSDLQLMVDSLNDAIKVGLIESVKFKNKAGSILNSVLQSKITKSEITWYIHHLYSADQHKNIDKKVLIEMLFDLLLIKRTCFSRDDGNYVVTGESVKDGEKTIGILLTANHDSVKHVPNVEPQVQ